MHPRSRFDYGKIFFERRGYRVVKRQEVERQGVLLTNYIMEKYLALRNSVAYEFPALSSAGDMFVMFPQDQSLSKRRSSENLTVVCMTNPF